MAQEIIHTEHGISSFRCLKCKAESDMGVTAEFLDVEPYIEDGYWVFTLASYTMTTLRAGCEHIEASSEYPVRFRIQED